MRILNKYILKQLLVSFVLILLGMTALVWLTQSLKMLDMIVTKGVSVNIFLKMTLLVLPNFIQILSPLSLFAVTLFIFSRMQADKEIMVMQAVGMSRLNIMTPALILASILTVFGYFLTLFLIPQSNINLREMKWKVRNDLSHLLLQEGQFNSFKNGLTLYVKERQADGSIRGVMAYNAKDPEKISTLIAREGTVFQENDVIQVVFQQGTRQEYNPKTRQFSILKFDTYTMLFNDKEGADQQRISDVREYSLGHLITTSKADAPSPALYRKFKVEAVKRLTQPLYNFTFVMLALFGILSGAYNRRGQMGRINFVVVMALLVQSLALAFENIAGKNLLFLPLMPLNIFLPVLLAYAILIRRKPLPFFKKIIPVLLILLLSGNVWAAPKPAPVSLDKDQPVEFEADSISFDKKNDVLTARGDVIIEQNGTVLKTPLLTFDRRRNEIFVPEKALIILPDGTRTQTGPMSITTDMNSALGKSISMTLFDETQITASQLKRSESGNTLRLRDVTYTPCDTCETEAPLWQLRAKQMKHDALKRTFSYKHAFLDIKDVPVFYFPYISMPDHTVKRKTGFLIPGLSHGTTMKGGIDLPFFWNIADNQNLLITPTFSSSHFPLGVLDYQGRYDTSFLNLQLSGTKDEDDARQGHINTSFVYDLTKKWRLSGQLFKVSSDTYFRRYPIPDIDDTESFLTSHLTAERFGTRTYFKMSGLSFQSLENGVASESIPVVLPTADYHYQTRPLFDNGLYGYTHLNTALINTRERFKSNRFSMEQGLHLPYVSPFGLKADMIGSVRADGYVVDTGRYGLSTRKPDDSYLAGRLYPNFSVEVGYPMAKVSGSSTQILEPIVMAVFSPNGNNDEKIPNRDSLLYDFDESNLFSRNRFSGYDRVESGNRLNYGLKWSLYNTNNRSISTLFGQSYRLRTDNQLSRLIGYATKFSDYVGRIQLQYRDVSFSYHFRLDKNTFAPNKSEIAASVGRAPLRIGASYVYLKKTQTGNIYYPSREEILVYGTSQFTKNLSLFGSYRYNLAKNGGPIEFDASIRYDNECAAVLFEVGKSFTRDRDYKGDTSFMVKFILKTLGDA